MKLTATSPLPIPTLAAPAPAADEPARPAQRPAPPEKASDGASLSRTVRNLAQAGGSERQSRAQGFEFKRALTRGRIEGLQTALRILTQPCVTDAARTDLPDLPELRTARVALCDRLQAQYMLFLADPSVTPAGLPRSSRGSWRRSQLRQLLQEDLDWVRSLPGDHQDLARAIRACLERVVPHSPL